MKKKDYLNLFIIYVFCILIVLFVYRFTNVFGSDTDWINQHTVFPEYLRNLTLETYQTGTHQV